MATDRFLNGEAGLSHRNSSHGRPDYSAKSNRGPICVSYGPTPNFSPASLALTTYHVKRGDCLWRIARDNLGDPRLWIQIAAINGLRPPYVIFAGQALRIPASPRGKLGRTGQTVDIKRSCWDAHAQTKAAISPLVLPELTSEPTLTKITLPSVLPCLNVAVTLKLKVQIRPPCEAQICTYLVMDPENPSSGATLTTVVKDHAVEGGSGRNHGAHSGDMDTAGAMKSVAEEIQNAETHVSYGPTTGKFEVGINLPKPVNPFSLLTPSVSLSGTGAITVELESKEIRVSGFDVTIAGVLELEPEKSEDCGYPPVPPPVHRRVATPVPVQSSKLLWCLTLVTSAGAAIKFYGADIMVAGAKVIKWILANPEAVGEAAEGLAVLAL